MLVNLLLSFSLSWKVTTLIYQSLFLFALHEWKLRLAFGNIRKLRPSVQKKISWLVLKRFASRLLEPIKTRPVEGGFEAQNIDKMK